MDPNSPWEDNPDTDHVPKAEWSKITSEFTNSGYREGIITGKEVFLQQGFDAHFADVGLPLGREVGNLRGAAAALRSVLNTRNPGSIELEEIQGVSSAPLAIQLSNIASCDLDAQQHAKEHLDSTVVENTDSQAGMAPQERCTVEDLAKLKERLVLLCAKFGLPILA